MFWNPSHLFSISCQSPGQGRQTCAGGLIPGVDVGAGHNPLASTFLICKVEGTHPCCALPSRLFGFEVMFGVCDALCPVNNGVNGVVRVILWERLGSSPSSALCPPLIFCAACPRFASWPTLLDTANPTAPVGGPAQCAPREAEQRKGGCPSGLGLLLFDHSLKFPGSCQQGAVAPHTWTPPLCLLAEAPLSEW